MRENRAARFGKQANHAKRGKTSIRHRDQVKQQQKNNQTNKEGGAKKGKRRHDCKANHARFLTQAVLNINNNVPQYLLHYV